MSHQLDSHWRGPFHSLVARLKRLARRYRVPPSESDDCAQEALLALLIAHPDWPIENPRTIAWLCGVTRNQALSLHRDRRRHPSRSLDELGRVLSHKSPLPSERDAGRDGPSGAIAARAQALLNNLSEINRRIVIQRVQKGRGFSEIGDAFGLTAHQVKARYLRALKSIRRRCNYYYNNASKGEQKSKPTLRNDKNAFSLASASEDIHLAMTTCNRAVDGLLRRFAKSSWRFSPHFSRIT